MTFTRSDNAFTLCRKHLEQLKQDSQTATLAEIAEIESLLVASLTLLVISSYENHIESLFTKRASKCGDSKVISFVADSVSKKFRSPDRGKIHDHLNKFSADYKKEFMDRIGDSMAAAWDTIMRARHEVVHGPGSTQLTFEELCSAYEKTLVIVTELESVLST